jgi:hypothetical protein
MPLPVVAPFYRASVTVGPIERRLFARRLDDAAFPAAVRAAPWILRQNMRRLFAAAMLADALGARLVSVEGWRSNAIGRRRGANRFVSGSWMFAVLLRLLRRRRLVPDGMTLIRRDVSRCTWEEAHAIAAMREPGADLIGISDDPCPSARRAARYLRGAGDCVITPRQALARAAELSSGQRALWDALQPRPGEMLQAPILEAPNWVLHLASEALRGVGLDEPPLEARLARALRADRR